MTKLHRRHSTKTYALLGSFHLSSILPHRHVRQRSKSSATNKVELNNAEALGALLKSEEAFTALPSTPHSHDIQDEWLQLNRRIQEENPSLTLDPKLSLENNRQEDSNPFSEIVGKMEGPKISIVQNSPAKELNGQEEKTPHHQLRQIQLNILKDTDYESVLSMNADWHDNEIYAEQILEDKKAISNVNQDQDRDYGSIDAVDKSVRMPQDIALSTINEPIEQVDFESEEVSKDVHDVTAISPLSEDTDSPSLFNVPPLESTGPIGHRQNFRSSFIPSETKLSTRIPVLNPRPRHMARQRELMPHISALETWPHNDVTSRLNTTAEIVVLLEEKDAMKMDLDVPSWHPFPNIRWAPLSSDSHDKSQIPSLVCDFLEKSKNGQDVLLIGDAARLDLIEDALHFYS